MTDSVINQIWNWAWFITLAIDDIYIPAIGCSLLEALLGMLVFSLMLSLLIPWVYFEEDIEI